MPHPTWSDQELIAACVQGDAQAWELLVARYRRLIYTIPVRFGLPPAQADDVFQSVCLILLRRLDSLRDVERLAGWLITVTRHECGRVARASNSRHAVALEEMSEDGGESAHELIADVAALDEALVRLEQANAVRSALEAMPDRCRDLLTMLYLDERDPSYQDISRALGIAVGTIGPTRARCLQRLRNILSQMRADGF